MKVGLVAPVAEPLSEPGRRERATELGDKEGQVARGRRLDAGDEGVTLESIEFVTEGGRVLTADEVMDIVEGRAEMPD